MFGVVLVCQQSRLDSEKPEVCEGVGEGVGWICRQIYFWFTEEPLKIQSILC